MSGLLAEFKKCLVDMSYSRAGWDYTMSPEQRAAERSFEREAKSRARSIWAENPSIHEDLREVFSSAKPLVTMDEIAG